ncbi:MAG: tRNA pseudouridine(38-40) synthase TruA [Thainema sp.]
MTLLTNSNTLVADVNNLDHSRISTRRIALVVQYNGANFYGWQRQPNHRTVQAEIESLLEEILGARTVVYAAGRTDTGVHAAAQVAHFNTSSLVPPHRWASILNRRLPSDVVVRASAEVPHYWHAQFSALWRRYRYMIYTDKLPNVFVQHLAWHYYSAPLDANNMQAALKPLAGRHDLSAFRRAGSKRVHSWVDIQAAECWRQGAFVTVEIQANGFLYGMIRLIMGLLVEVGIGDYSPEYFTDLWQMKRRDLVKSAAPSHGLCLLRVGYAEFPFSKSVWFDAQPQFQ